MILHSQQILLLGVTMVMITLAMKCDKLILTSGSVGNNGVISTQSILETGRYVVTTTGNIRSNKVQSLIERLNGASNIQYSDNSFTATLVPKDLKKVAKFVLQIIHDTRCPAKLNDSLPSNYFLLAILKIAN